MLFRSPAATLFFHHRPLLIRNAPGARWPFSMPVFPHLPLGQRIPGGPHSVSCSLPTMRDVRGYEEKDPAVMRALSSGYPRFVVHPFARRLAEHLVANDAALRGRELWLVPSSGAAMRLAEHLGATGGALVFARDGLHGLSHPASAELSSRAKTYQIGRAHV